MKKLIKVEFVGLVNSVQVHCSQKTGSTVAAEKKKKKKKKKKENANAAL